jgi:histidinol-phosphate aminotransferase
MKDAIDNIKTERKRIVQTLQKYDSFEVFDSKANFVLFDAHSSYKRVFAALAEQGISIRKLGKIGNHEGCLRVTIGTKEMNSKFLLAIRDLLG